MSKIGKTLLKGHALRDEGRPNYDAAGLYRWRGGYARCECGALFGPDAKVTAAQRWHREHKDGLR